MLERENSIDPYEANLRFIYEREESFKVILSLSHSYRYLDLERIITEEVIRRFKRASQEVSIALIKCRRSTKIIYLRFRRKSYNLD